ncbi:MAG: malectin domain-containing carbohydrate-binding protein [Bryobacteraceae bacterium]
MAQPAPSAPRSDGPPSFAAERAELKAILASEAFQRAPTLAQVLSYICEKCFAGQQELIKEYNIAVEALGRPPEFDQKRDSIVRVEAHRLRKRLKEYYDGEGKDHRIRIELPLGAYVPVFVRQEHGDAEDAAAQARAPESVPAPTRDAPGEDQCEDQSLPRPFRWLGAAAGFALLAALAVFMMRDGAGGSGEAVLKTPAKPVDLMSTVTMGELRVAAGSSESLRDTDGMIWHSDRYFEGGSVASAPHMEVSGTLTPALFRSWRQGEFRYKIPLKPGTYELTLWFCEPKLSSGLDNTRTFRIWINGQMAVEEFDIMTEAGAGQTVTARTWKDISPAADGFLHLAFTPLGDAPLLSALSVVPGTPGRLRPIRIAAREEPYRDSAGYVWSSDRFFFGGKLVKRIEPIQGTDDPELYRGERYGRLTYTIPAPPDSTYTAVFHFAETWFGSKQGGGGAGSRLFDILCNGLLLERNLDVYREAGGPFRVLRKTYRGLKPTLNGKLVFQLVPGRNYAFLNALEVLDEGRPLSGARPQK